MEGEKCKFKRFDRDFKIQAVKMVAESSHTTAEVARSLGIHQNQRVRQEEYEKYSPRNFAELAKNFQTQ